MSIASSRVQEEGAFPEQQRYTQYHEIYMEGLPPEPPRGGPATDATTANRTMAVRRGVYGSGTMSEGARKAALTQADPQGKNGGWLPQQQQATEGNV
jgi:hypothetical protein